MNKVICISTVLVALLASPVFWGASLPHAEYTSEELFTIPWGDGPGELTTEWNYELWEPPAEDRCVIWPPGPWGVSSHGDLVLAQNTSDGSRLNTYDRDGSLIASINIRANGLWMPNELAMSDTGEILLGYSNELVWLSPSLEEVARLQLPHTAVLIERIVPSDRSSFLVLYDSQLPSCDSPHIMSEKYLIECFTDGSTDEPVLLLSYSSGDPAALEYCYVSPDGAFHSTITDMHGYSYRFPWTDETVDPWGIGRHFMERLSSDGRVVYAHDFNSEEGWRMFDERYFLTWSGDFYTLHATDEGAVLTKYTLQME